MKRKTIITYGTFDLFHIGHLNLLRRMKDIGTFSVVAVSTDEFNELKGKKTIIPYEQRVEIVSAIKYVDVVIPEGSWEQKVGDIKKYDVDTFVIGKDWKGKFDFLSKYCNVEYLDRTKGVSTTKLKKSLRNFISISTEELNSVFEVLDRLRKEFS